MMGSFLQRATTLAVAVLIAMATACGSSSHNGGGTAPPSIVGSWNLELTQNGTTQSLFQTTLVSETVVSGGCNLLTKAGAITVQALTLKGCYVADSMTNQGSFTCSGCIFMPQGVLVETLQNSVDVNILVVETDPNGALFVFLGNGTTTNNDGMAGNWMCDTGWSTACLGWSGTFSGTRLVVRGARGANAFRL